MSVVPSEKNVNTYISLYSEPRYCDCATCGGANLQDIKTTRNKSVLTIPGIDGFAAVVSKSTRNSWNIFLVYGFRLDVYLWTKKW